MYRDSVYDTHPNNNVPKDASYPYGAKYLTARLQETHYPWDSVYDSQYQQDIKDPRYRWYGNVQYPYYVRRHRIPMVFSEPKYKRMRVGNGVYQIPPYPPYAFWNPSPLECRDMCGRKVCGQYYEKLNNYRMCQFCQNLKTPQCWNAKTQRCEQCAPEQALSSCEGRFGCRNPSGWLQDNVAPINPKYTGCRVCN